MEELVTLYYLYDMVEDKMVYTFTSEDLLEKNDKYDYVKCCLTTMEHNYVVLRPVKLAFE